MLHVSFVDPRCLYTTVFFSPLRTPLLVLVVVVVVFVLVVRLMMMFMMFMSILLVVSLMVMVSVFLLVTMIMPRMMSITRPMSISLTSSLLSYFSLPSLHGDRQFPAHLPLSSPFLIPAQTHRTGTSLIRQSGDL